VLVVDDGFGDGLEGANDAVLDEGGGLRRLLVTILAHQVQLETAQVPLAANTVVVAG